MANIITDVDDDEAGQYLTYLLEGQSYAEADPTDDSKWTPVPNFPAEIGIDDVNTYLLDVARREFATVKRLFMERAYGGYQGARKSPASVEPMTILTRFLNQESMGLIRLQINQHITGDPYSTNEMMAFVKVQLYLSFYKCSPTALSTRLALRSCYVCKL